MERQPVFDPKADSPLPDEALRAKKDRYGRFELDQLRQALAREPFGPSIIGIEPLSLGTNAFDHLVFRLRMEDGGARICRVNADAVAEDFSVEAAVYGAWRAAGIPGPEVFSIRTREGAEGFDYMVCESVGTADLERHLIEHPEEARAYARASGAFLARLHGVQVPGFGMLEWAEGSLRGAHASWKEALLVTLEETLAYLLQSGLLSESEAEAVRSAFSHNEHLLALPQGVLLHGDYHDANILIDADRTEVVAAVDVSQAKAGDPWYDLAFYGTYVSPERFAAFCEGYFAGSFLPDEFEKRIALYQLRIYASKAKLRKRFGYEERIPAALEGLRRSLTRLA